MEVKKEPLVIVLNVDGQRLEAVHETIYSGIVGALKVKVNFTGWNEKQSVMRFAYGEGIIIDRVIDDEYIKVPDGVILPPGFSIAIGGYTSSGDVLERFVPTCAVEIPVERSGYGKRDTEFGTEEEQKSLSALILEKAETAMASAENAEASAKDAKTAATSAEAAALSAAEDAENAGVLAVNAEASAKAAQTAAANAEAAALSAAEDAENAGTRTANAEAAALSAAAAAEEVKKLVDDKVDEAELEALSETVEENRSDIQKLTGNKLDAGTNTNYITELRPSVYEMAGSVCGGIEVLDKDGKSAAQLTMYTADTTPKSGSTELISSGGVYKALEGKLDVTTVQGNMLDDGDYISLNTSYKITEGMTGETYFIYVPYHIGTPIQYKITSSGIFRRTSALVNDELSWSDWQEYVSKEYVDSVAEKIAADADKKIKQNIPHDTVTGSSVTLTDHITNMEVRDYRIYGNSIQDGEPTPDAPIDIQSVGDLVTDKTDEHYGKYDVPVTVRGKNLFNKDYFIETCNASVASGYEVTEETFGGKECMKVYGIALGIIKKYPTVFKENTQYTISFDHYDVPYNNNVGMIITAKYSDETSEKVFTSGTTGGVWKTHSWTSAAGKTISYLSYSYGTGAAYTYISNWQIEEGTSVTAYEPYTSETYHIYLDEPLRKVGDYADYIDYQNQQVVRMVEVHDDTGTKTIEESLGGLNEATTEAVTMPQLTIPEIDTAVIECDTAVESNMEVTYYQDINKIIAELKAAYVAQGGIQ